MANHNPYGAIMPGMDAHIEVLMDVKRPIELADFVSAFVTIGNQYQRYMRQNYPDLSQEARVFVREVRPGSIVADLLPSFANLIVHMDQAAIVENFVRVYGERLANYFRIGGRARDASKGELKDFMGSVAAIANTPNSRGYIRAISYEDGKREIRASVEFDTETARRAIAEIEDHKKEFDAIESTDYERVLMVFKRSDVGDSGIGVRSGERVFIEEISDDDRALIYGSKLAEERIKDQMRNTEENRLLDVPSGIH